MPLLWSKDPKNTLNNFFCTYYNVVNPIFTQNTPIAVKFMIVLSIKFWFHKLDKMYIHVHAHAIIWLGHYLYDNRTCSVVRNVQLMLNQTNIWGHVGKCVGTPILQIQLLGTVTTITYYNRNIVVQLRLCGFPV